MKNIFLNLSIFILTYVIPLSIYKYYESDYRQIGPIQNYLFSTILLGSIVLIYLNHIKIKKTENLKWFYLLFKIVGIIGLIYSSIILYLIFSFRHGIGF